MTEENKRFFEYENSKTAEKIIDLTEKKISAVKFLCLGYFDFK